MYNLMEYKVAERRKIVWQVNNFARETISKYNATNTVKSGHFRTGYGGVHFELFPEDDDLKFKIGNKPRPHSSTITDLSFKVTAEYENNGKNVKVAKKFQLGEVESDFVECCSLLRIDDIPKDVPGRKEHQKTLRLHIDSDHSSLDEKGTFGGKQYDYNTVVDEIGSLFNSSDFSDLKITCSDGTVFPAHRFILAMRSPVFKAMLTTEMAEKKTSTITIDDIDGETMKHTLLFLYKSLDEGLTCLGNELASKLIYAADKYDLPGLMEICATNLNNSLGMENVISNLLIAEKFRQKDLKDVCLRFVAADFKELKETEEWKLLDSALVTEIMDIMKEMEDGIIAFVTSL